MTSASALDGVRVVALTHLAAGPLTAQTLGALGAEVIKVESPSGDLQRVGAVHPDGKFGGFASSFIAVSKNQRGIAIDLKSAEGFAIAKALIARADVVIENFRPGALDRRGLGYEDVRKWNDKVIYCSISAFDRTGPRKDEGGQDTIMQAISGLASLTGPKDRPYATGTFIMDWYSAAQAVIGILAALNYRNGTGKGQWVRVDMLSAAMHLQSAESTYVMNVEPELPRANGGLAYPLNGAPYGIFKTQDGAICIAALSRPQIVADIAARLGVREQIAPYLTPRALRFEGKSQVGDILASAIAERTNAEVMKLLQGVEGFGVVPVRTTYQALQDPAIAASGLIREIDGIYGGKHRVVTEPFRLSETPVKTRPAPALGEHTVEILRELGYDDGAIAACLANKTVVAIKSPG